MSSLLLEQIPSGNFCSSAPIKADASDVTRGFYQASRSSAWNNNLCTVALHRKTSVLCIDENRFLDFQEETYLAE